MLQSTKPGKAPTKGAKQILSENQATVSFYRNMGLAAVLLHTIIVMLLSDGFGLIMNLVIIVLYFMSYKLMKYVSRPKYGEGNQLLDPGIDLNMEGGMGEHIKDVVILASMTHVLAAVSNYFWYLLLLLPLRALYLLWVSVLGPWFFQAPDDDDVDDKKWKKKQRRAQFTNYSK